MDYTNFKVDDWALYIAKQYDLTVSEMNDVKQLFIDKKINDILDQYGDKLDKDAINVLKFDYDDTPAFIYYEIVNSVNEYDIAVTGRYLTENQAKEALKNKCNWYRPMGTGRINKVEFMIKSNGQITKNTKEVYCRS